jgi:hypothetical protein
MQKTTTILREYYPSISNKNPKNKSRKSQGKIIKNSKLNLKQKSISAKQQHMQNNYHHPDRLLKTLNHHYTMKIALISRNLRKKQHHSKTSTTEETY